MKALGRYAIASLAVLSALAGSGWWFVDPAARASLLTAAAIAWPVQVALFALLARSQGEPARFMLFWGFGILGRLGALAVVGLGLGALGGSRPDVLILALAGFLFALLLLEPFFLNDGNSTASWAR